jgi:hypothetical protein
MLLNIFNDIWTFLSGEKVFPAVISAITTVIVFFLTLFTKRYIDTRILSSKLETEHKFDQRKKIKEALAKYKVHLLTACEDMNHRLWNFSSSHSRKWIDVKGDYSSEQYFFHSTVYRILCVFAWIKKINKEMVYLDTTIATKEDLYFIKFLRVFPNVFCDLTFLVGPGADGSHAIDHFFRTNFDLFPDSIMSNNEIISYSEYKKNLPTISKQIESLYQYMDSISPVEMRMRWDRLHLFHLTLITFLNCYGYDFQQTSDKKINKVLTIPKISKYLENYFVLLTEYRLDQNKEVKRLLKLSKQYFGSNDKI